MDLHHESPKSYILGFILSILLTLAAYFAVAWDLLSEAQLLILLVSLGAIQTVVQLVLFLHLGKESKPRFIFLFFLFMALILVTIVAGSIWIMYHLDYNMS